MSVPAFQPNIIKVDAGGITPAEGDGNVTNSATLNPFLDYLCEIRYAHRDFEGVEFTVPGYFAGNGTSLTLGEALPNASGDIWHNKTSFPWDDGVGTHYEFTLTSVTGTFNPGDSVDWGAGTDGLVLQWDAGTSTLSVTVVTGAVPANGDTVTNGTVSGGGDIDSDPYKVEVWDYTVTMKAAAAPTNNDGQGPQGTTNGQFRLAVAEDPNQVPNVSDIGDGVPGAANHEGTVIVRAPEGEGFYQKGFLEAVGSRYFRWRRGARIGNEASYRNPADPLDGWFLEGGLNSPENFFGHVAFDNTTTANNGAKTKKQKLAGSTPSHLHHYNGARVQPNAFLTRNHELDHVDQGVTISFDAAGGGWQPRKGEPVQWGFAPTYTGVIVDIEFVTPQTGTARIAVTPGDTNPADDAVITSRIRRHNYDAPNSDEFQLGEACSWNGGSDTGIVAFSDYANGVIGIWVDSGSTDPADDDVVNASASGARGTIAGSALSAGTITQDGAPVTWSDTNWTRADGGSAVSDGLSGALNYLAGGPQEGQVTGVGLNSVYVILNTQGGDCWDMHPYLDPEPKPGGDYDAKGNFDLSKLDQVQVALEHCMRKGLVFNHQMTEIEHPSLFFADGPQETNNTFGEMLTIRRLLFREWVARNGWCNAYRWILSEEIQDQQGANQTYLVPILRDQCDWIRSLDYRMAKEGTAEYGFGRPICFHTEGLRASNDNWKTWGPYEKTHGEKRWGSTAWQPFYDPNSSPQGEWDHPRQVVEHWSQKWPNGDGGSGWQVPMIVDEPWSNGQMHSRRDQYRRLFMWPCYMRGGMLSIYASTGSGSDWGNDHTIETMEARKYSYADLTRIRKFVEAFHFWKFGDQNFPDGNVSGNTGAERQPRVFTHPQPRQVGVYLDNASSNRGTVLIPGAQPDTNWTYQWYNPRTGEWDLERGFVMPANRRFDMEANGPPAPVSGDWAVKIRPGPFTAAR
ncbi:MAG: hypothetical protein B7733_06200 [Myxococcales bacterium FL481]|nr:MAG: hypothetical protein B7733_06200 [Myxococcales bacterium FL481]